MNAPKKIYINPSDKTWYKFPWGEDSVEYTRTDAFIEKVKEFLSKEENIPLWSTRGGDFGCDTPKLVENFINFMKGE